MRPWRRQQDVRQAIESGMDELTWDVQYRAECAALKQRAWQAAVGKLRAEAQGGRGALLMSVQNPENGTVYYTYNSDGTMATRRDANNQTVNYSYDSLKRLTQVSRPDGTQDTYYYDTNPLAGRCTRRGGWRR